MNNEIPLGKRTRFYRFFEMVPALLSYGAIILLAVLSLLSPIIAAIYLLMIILTLLIKVIGMTYHMVTGRARMDKASLVNWQERLADLETPRVSYDQRRNTASDALWYSRHVENLRRVTIAEDGFFPKPSEVYNALIIPAYNEPFEVIDPTIQSVIDTSYNNQRLIVIFAYEERGGDEMKQTAARLEKKYKTAFHTFRAVEHPKDIANEVVGKGGNITYAGRWLKEYLNEQGISYGNVIVTTMDCDNKPHPSYFDYLTYEFILREDRKHLSFQPVCLFTSNIWDVPAPMRVIATGNSFWNIISSMRPHSLRNFASHSQPMDALVEMDFWSVRTIVEDGHQYWRSYFHFGGNYDVVPIHVPIYQDAVLSGTYMKTLKAQFTQLRRWAYGASDVPYVAERVFTKRRNVPFWPGFTRFVRLLDGHVTLACVSVMVAFGGWVPLLINQEAAARSIVVHQLPDTISLLQRIAMIGLAVAIFSAFKLLPPRPERYKKRRNILMLLQWFLMPITSVVYSSLSAYNAQTHLLLGKYLDKFDVTEKAMVADSAEADTNAPSPRVADKK